MEFPLTTMTIVAKGLIRAHEDAFSGSRDSNTLTEKQRLIFSAVANCLGVSSGQFNSVLNSSNNRRKLRKFFEDNFPNLMVWTESGLAQSLGSWSSENPVNPKLPETWV